MPRPLQKLVNRDFLKKSGETPQHCHSKKVAQRKRGSDEPKISQKLPGGVEVRPKQFFVGWVPNRQNRSPTDEMAPSALQNGHIPGPRDKWDPKQGSLGPHLACKRRGASSPERPPRPGKSTFWRFCPFSGPKRGREISLSPPDPRKPVNRELPDNFLSTTQRRQSKKVTQRKRSSDEVKIFRKLPAGAELRPK